MLEANSSSNAPPSPDAVLPPLDADQLRALRQVGSEWGQSSNGRSRSLPIDPSLSRQPALSQPTRGGRLVHVRPASGSPDALEATIDEDGTGGDRRTVGRRFRRAVLGPPLKSTAIVQERMRKLVALPVLSADALSSVAYGPEAMLAVLVLAGGPGLGWSLPISGAIAFLMLAVGLSYRQTIRAYPHGGGSYIVASANLGRVPGLLAAAGLITDYVLTVAVSISSGLAAVTSAIPSLQAAVVPIGLALIAFLLAANLRGVRQAGALFAAPTYAFIFAIALLLIVGLVDAGRRGFHPVPAPVLHASQGVGLLLVLRAFASGSTAMTGIEAISNGLSGGIPNGWDRAARRRHRRRERSDPHRAGGQRESLTGYRRASQRPPWRLLPARSGEGRCKTRPTGLLPHREQRIDADSARDHDPRSARLASPASRRAPGRPFRSPMR